MSDVALPQGADARRLGRQLLAAHDEFLGTGRAGSGMRQVVLDSWRRSLDGGMDPESSLARIAVADSDLAEVRAAHPLSTVLPVIRRLLVDSATDAGLLVAVSDAAGQLLWVEGPSRLRRIAESMHFMAGADWSEASAGTNAPGTALALDQAVQIFGYEHLSRVVTPWSCSAAPIHDPDTGAMLGVLDLTGGPEVATAQSLALVKATALAAEYELRLSRLRAHIPVVTPAPSPRLDVLGERVAVLTHSATTTRLGLRHSELLLLLATHERGMTTGELGVALSAQDHPLVTIRAELSRLRHLVGSFGSIGLEARPYRLTERLDLDVDRVRAALRLGQVRRAVAAYHGPVLPHSEAPAITDLRESLHAEVRSHVLAGHDADALLAFADTDHGRDDFDVWYAALKALPVTSPRYAEVLARCERLEAL